MSNRELINGWLTATFFVLITLATAAVFAVSGATFASENIEQTCAYDHDAMIALDESAFDQDLDGGWRVLAKKPECIEVAADLILEYRRVNGTERTTLHWHEGQLRAAEGQYEQAIELFKQTRRPVEQDIFGWNPYVDATIAFLEDDYERLIEARDALKRVPLPDEDMLPKDQDGNQIELDWPLNLHVVERMVACFGNSYAEAYGDCESERSR